VRKKVMKSIGKKQRGFLHHSYKIFQRGFLGKKYGIQTYKDSFGI